MSNFFVRRSVLASALAGLLGGASSVARGLEKKQDVSHKTPEHFGAIGNGVADDSVPLKAALQFGRARLNAGKTYNLGGADIQINNSLLLEIGNGAKLTNGRLQLHPTDTARRLEIGGDLVMQNGSVRIWGDADPEWTDPTNPDRCAIILTCGDIVVTGRYPGTGGALEIWKVKSSSIGNLTVRGDGGAANALAVQLTDVFDSDVLSVSVEGKYAMGVEFDHSATERPAYSLVRSRVGRVRVRRVGLADVSGDHGVYLHGAYKSEIGVVQATGWGDTISSCADFKFRDNKDCKIGRVEVGRLRITSNNNYRWFTMYNEGSVLEDVKCSISLVTAVNRGGRCSEVVLKNVVAPVVSLDTNENFARGIIFSGKCMLGGKGDAINTTGIAFENARVTFIGAPVLKGSRYQARNVEFTNDVKMAPNVSSVTQFQNVRVQGTLDHDASPNASTHTLDYLEVYVSGEIRANSAGPRVVKATWRKVVSGMPEPAAARSPGSKVYRNVAFSNVSYASLDTP